jgi:hypothetical protein
MTATHISDESALLMKINEGWPEENWRRYGELICKRRAETLTEPEREELIALGDDLEMWNVRMLERLLELARLRQTSLDAVMKELGIKPRPI